MDIICGCDISSKWVDVSLEGKSAKRFEQTREGFGALADYAKGSSLVVMEATGAYHVALADFPVGRGFAVSVVNPARASAYSAAVGQRNKTDKCDARSLALFARGNAVPAYLPQSKERREFQALVRERSRLVADAARLKTQLKAPELGAFVRELLGERLALYKAQIARAQKRAEEVAAACHELAGAMRLLRTLPGFGSVAAMTVLAELDPERFKTAKQAAAFAGVTLREFSSGSSVRKATRMSKRGNAALRKALFMPALVAVRRSCFNAFYDRLLERGKSKLAAIGAVMHKLLRTAFAILETKKPYEPQNT